MLTGNASERLKLALSPPSERNSRNGDPKMSLFNKVEEFGRRGRYSMTAIPLLGYMVLARELLSEMSPEASDTLMAEINTKATKLLTELTAKVDANVISKAELLSLVEQVDELHCAGDGLRDLLVRFNFPINQEELVKLYDLHVAMLAQLAKSGLTFKEIMEHLTRSRKLLSPPMGCYSALPDSPWNNEEDEDFGVVIQGTIIVIELDLDTAPTHLPGSAGGFVMATHISKLQLDSSPRRGGLDKVQRQFQLILKLLERLPKLRN